MNDGQCHHPEKIKYSTEEAAEAALVKRQEQDWSGTRGLRAYLCKSGDHYHLGHPAPTLEKRIRLALNGGRV
jgi:hypothetical protein